jgi:hypothetical protein
MLTTLTEATRNIVNAKLALNADIEAASFAAGKELADDDLWVSVRKRRAMATIVHNVHAVGCETLDEFVRMVGDNGYRLGAAVVMDAFVGDMPDIQVGRDLVMDFNKFTALSSEE